MFIYDGPVEAAAAVAAAVPRGILGKLVSVGWSGQDLSSSILTTTIRGNVVTGGSSAVGGLAIYQKVIVIVSKIPWCAGGVGRVRWRRGYGTSIGVLGNGLSVGSVGRLGGCVGWVVPPAV